MIQAITIHSPESIKLLHARAVYAQAYRAQRAALEAITTARRAEENASAVRDAAISDLKAAEAAFDLAITGGPRS